MNELLENALTSTPYYDPAEERKAFIARVIAEGYDVVSPKANELQIDIDTEEQYVVFHDSLAMLIANSTTPNPRVVERPSRSGLPHMHISVTLPYDVTPWQRIAMQAALGSDPRREVLSCVRLMRGDEHPTLFVEAKKFGHDV